MTFLIRRKFAGKPAIAHIWFGDDTACRMWSTGGIGRNRPFDQIEILGDHPICQMCQTNAAKLEAQLQ